MRNRYIFLIVAGIFLLILAACDSNYEGDFSYEVEAFEYTNQNGDSFNSEELEGEFWVADMIFTNCIDVCLPMTANMAKLQEKLKEEGLQDEVQLISFSIDPENDTPAILKKYSQDRGGEFSNWNLLTGYSFDEIKRLSIQSFKAPLEKVPDSDQFVHVTSFYLVTPEGNAIKRYDGTDSESIDQIVKDIKKIK